MPVRTTYQAPTSEVQRAIHEVYRCGSSYIGAVPVIYCGKLVGIFSERDLMRRVVAEGRDPRSTCMAEVMTDDPLAVGTGEDLETCMALMRRHGFRHLPVCHEGQLVGMVSLRDILLHDLNEKDDEVRMMRAYIHSVPDA